MKLIQADYEVVVIGGGMAGFCAAIAAARSGARTCLVQDRPVLGGNASSEVRVTVHGAACHHTHCRETGIIGEAMQAERRMNHLFPIENGWTNSVHDLALYNMAVEEPNLTLHLNTSLRDVQLSDGSWGLGKLAEWPVATAEKGYMWRPACHDGDKITAIRAIVANAETELQIAGKYFVDCTGDGVMAHLAGCEWRMGSESREETGEVHAPEHSSTDTMGNSIHFRCIDTGQPAPFQPPSWAKSYDDASFFYEQGRAPVEPQGGYWWIEIGVPWNTIYDNETIRHELTRHALGVWDWMKNKDPKTMERCRNYALEFIGQVPGKRESRRIMGLHLLNENELQRREVFADECAYGGWFIDLHTPGGLLAATSEPDSAVGYNSALKSVALKLIGPYGIPMRSLLSKDVKNLAMAGRNISVTHAALGTVRVMGTCGLMGQAVGTLAATAARKEMDLGAVVETAMPTVQQRMLRDGCFLPNYSNTDSTDVARAAEVTVSSSWQFSGLGVWDEVEDKNLRPIHWACGRGRIATLNTTPCQWFPLVGGKLDRIGLPLLNKSEQSLSASICLRKVTSLWDYAVEGDVVWSGEVEVAAGADGYFWLETDLNELSEGYYRLEAKGPDSLAWRLSGNRALGFAGGFIVGSGRFHWNRLRGEMAMAFEPAQPIYSGAEVLTGVTRPNQRSNTWLSDPSSSLPQWVELKWQKEMDVRTIELNFPVQLILETHWENPFYVGPHVAKHYRLEQWRDGAWQTLLQVRDNHLQQRSHNLDTPISTTRVRLLIEATHGGRSAGLTEIRCYG